MKDIKIKIKVENKIAKSPPEKIVCGNKNYVIDFEFDEEWAEYEEKTAFFVANGVQLPPVIFQGNKCPVPVLSNTTSVKVGVSAGDLYTTTSALIGCYKSARCGLNEPQEPTPDVYAQLMQMINDGKIKGDTGEKGEKGEKGDAGSIKIIPVVKLPDKTDPTIDTSAIYVEPLENPDEKNKYGEYIFVNGDWEPLGEITIEVDHSECAKKTDLNHAVKVGVTTNPEKLTNEEKAAACAWLGAIPQIFFGKGRSQIYVNKPNGELQIIELGVADGIPSGYAIPVANGAGNISVADPTKETHAIPKGYFEKKTKHLPKDTRELTELVNTTYTTTLDESTGIYGGNVAFTTPIEDSIPETINVVFDGVKYNDLTVGWIYIEALFGDEQMPCAGNLSLINSLLGTTYPDTGEKFAMVFHYGYCIIVSDLTQSTVHTVAVSVTTSGELVKLERKFLPEGVGLQANYNQNDGSKGDYIKGRPFYDARRNLIDGTFTFSPMDAGMSESYGIIPLSETLIDPLNDLNKATIIFNGAEYSNVEFIATEQAIFEGGAVCMSDSSLQNYPFDIWYGTPTADVANNTGIPYGTPVLLVYVTDLYPVTYPLTIKLGELKKIDDKYLPDDLLRTADREELEILLASILARLETLEKGSTT